MPIYGVDVSPAVLLSNFLPASKFLKLVEDSARKFKVDKKRFGNAGALRRFHERVKDGLDELEDVFGEKAEECP